MCKYDKIVSSTNKWGNESSVKRTRTYTYNMWKKVKTFMTWIEKMSNSVFLVHWLCKEDLFRNKI